MPRHIVCKTSELPPGQRRIVEIEGRSIGVFNLEGTYHALRNVCPHQLAPLCLGKITGTTAPAPPGEYRWERQGQIIRCPWHGWEFDITTGRSVFNPHKLRVKTYAVTVEPPAPGTGSPTGTTAESNRTREPAPGTGSPMGATAAISRTCESTAPAAHTDEDPRVETYPVRVEEGLVVLHL